MGDRVGDQIAQKYLGQILAFENFSDPNHYAVILQPSLECLKASLQHQILTHELKTGLKKISNRFETTVHVMNYVLKDN